jgi:hypothetical protein
LYGQSAGATHVLGLMASPLAKGLFHKGWMASGSPRYDKLAKDAYEDNLVYLNKTKCSTVDCLLALTSQEATEAVPWDDFPNWDMYDQYDIPKKLTKFDGSMAIVDGKFCYIYLFLENSHTCQSLNIGKSKNFQGIKLYLIKYIVDYNLSLVKFRCFVI